MYGLVRRFIKTAIGFLIVGLALGVYIIVERELFLVPPRQYVVSAHTHAIFVGFVVLMIMGVALWLFPRPDKNDQRYSPRLAGASYWIVTIATAARIAGELARLGSSASVVRVLVAATGLAQAIGVSLFFYTMWTRVRSVGSASREARGERF